MQRNLIRLSNPALLSALWTMSGWGNLIFFLPEHGRHFVVKSEVIISYLEYFAAVGTGFLHLR